MTLLFEHEEIVCHAEVVDSKKPSLTAQVIVRFEDKDGNEWRCDKEIRLRLRKVSPVAPKERNLTMKPNAKQLVPLIPEKSSPPALSAEQQEQKIPKILG